MSFEISSANGYIALLDAIDAFLTTNGKAFDPSFTGVGNGKISAWDGTPTSVAETWTITATSATNFTVVGSTSGAQADATVGTPYDNGLIKFTLTAGGTSFVAGDQFKINTCPKWMRMVRETSDTKGQPYIVWRAPGNDGAQSIYMGMACFQDVGNDYYSISISWLTGYDSNIYNLANQPGAISGTYIMPYVGLWTAAVPYWLCANGQMFRFCAKISAVYQHGYLGFLKSYISPNNHPYPMFAGGSHGYLETRRYSDTSEQTHAYWRGYNNNDPGSQNRHAGLFRMPSGAVIGCYSTGYNTTSPYNAHMIPWSGAHSSGSTPMLNQRENLDGSYLLRPIVLAHDPDTSTSRNFMMLGEFDGVYAIAGYAQTAENTIRRGQIDHVVFHNVFRTAQDQYCAFALN